MTNLKHFSKTFVSTLRDMRVKRFNARETATLIECGYVVSGDRTYAERDGNVVYPKR